MIVLLVTSALAGAPLFDVAAHGTFGAGGATNGDGAFGALGRGGGGFTGWITPRVGLGARVDYGSYGFVPGDDPNAFVFAEGAVRAGEHVQVGIGVGTPVVWVEYACFTTPCVQGPWERHYPIGVLSAGWDLSTGALLLVPGVRAEVGGSRWGVGADVSVGLRLRRRQLAVPTSGSSSPGNASDSS